MVSDGICVDDQPCSGLDQPHGETSSFSVCKGSSAQRSEVSCSETEPGGCGLQTGGQMAMIPGLASFHTNLAGYLSGLNDSVSLLFTV